MKGLGVHPPLVASNLLSYYSFSFFLCEISSQLPQARLKFTCMFKHWRLFKILASDLLFKYDRVLTVMSLLPLQSWKNVSAFTGLHVLKLLSFSTLTQQQISPPQYCSRKRMRRIHHTVHARLHHSIHKNFPLFFFCAYMTAGLYIMHFVSCRWGVQQTCHRHFCVCEQVSFGYHTYKRNCPISRWPSDPETGTSHCRQLNLNIYALSSFHYY